MDIKTYIWKFLEEATASVQDTYAKDIAWDAYLQACGAYKWYILEHGFDGGFCDWWDKEIRPEFLRLAGIQNI